MLPGGQVDQHAACSAGWSPSRRCPPARRPATARPGRTRDRRTPGRPPRPAAARRPRTAARSTAGWPPARRPPSSRPPRCRRPARRPAPPAPGPPGPGGGRARWRAARRRAAPGRPASTCHSSGPTSWSQSRTGWVSCRIAVTPASLRAFRRRSSSSTPSVPGSMGGHEDHVAGVPGHRQVGHVAAPAGQQPGLAGLRQQPQRGPVLGVVVRLRGDVRAAGGEQQPAVRQEGRLGLARRRPGQPAGRPPALRVDLPQRGGVALAVRGPLRHRGDQPAAVRGQREPADPGERDVVVEVLERGAGRVLLGHERESSSGPVRAGIAGRGAAPVARRPVPGRTRPQQVHPWPARAP